MQLRSEKLCKQGAAYMLQAPNKKCRELGCLPGAATGDHRAAWSTGEPEQMLIQELREAGSKGPFTDIPPAAFPTSRRSLSHGSPVRSAHLQRSGWSQSHTRKRGGLGVWDSPSSTNPLPSWNKTQGLSRGISGAGHGEAANSWLTSGTQTLELQEAKFQSWPLGGNF